MSSSFRVSVKTAAARLHPRWSPSNIATSADFSTTPSHPITETHSLGIEDPDAQVTSVRGRDDSAHRSVPYQPRRTFDVGSLLFSHIDFTPGFIIIYTYDDAAEVLAGDAYSTAASEISEGQRRSTPLTSPCACPPPPPAPLRRRDAWIDLPTVD